MTYQDIITLIALKAAITARSARIVARHYWKRRVLRKDKVLGYYLTNGRYYEDEYVLHALNAANQKKEQVTA